MFFLFSTRVNFIDLFHQPDQIHVNKINFRITYIGNPRQLDDALIRALSISYDNSVRLLHKSREMIFFIEMN